MNELFVIMLELMRDNPIIQLLLAIVIFILGASLGGMYVKIQVLEDKVKSGGTAAVKGNPGDFGNQGGTQPTAPPTPTSVQVKLLEADPVKGDPKAKVTVTEFADFQCPFCGRFHTDAYLPIVKDYVDTGKVKFVYKQLAILGKESTDAANASLCAKEQNKFWEYFDYLYTHQQGENQGAFSPDNLKKFAAELGLNISQFNTCLDDQKYNDQVQADIAEATRLGFNSTPSIAVGKTPIIGAQPYAQFKAAIEAELNK